MMFKLALMLHMVIPVGIVTLFSYTQLLSKYKNIKSFVLYYLLLLGGFSFLIVGIDNFYMFTILSLIMQLAFTYICYLDSYKKVYQIVIISFIIQLLSYILTIIPLSFLYPITPQVSYYFDREFTMYAFMLYDTWFLSLSFYYVLEFTKVKKSVSFFKYSTLFICQGIFAFLILLLSYDFPTSYFIIIIIIVFIVVLVTDYILIKTYKSIIMDFLDLFEITRINEMIKQEKELKSIKSQIYHDIEKTQALLKRDLDGEAHDYIKSKYNELKAMNIERYSHNKMIDLVIYNKVQIMREKGIKDIVDVTLCENMNIVDIDIVTLLFNILDNAIEACDKIENSKFINIKIFEKYNCIYIEVINSKSPHVIVDNLKTTKDDPMNHGIGITIIKNIVRKYKGDVLFEDNINTFRVKLFLKN